MPEKELVVVGGPNGAGKTTFAMDYVGKHGWNYLGADAIAAQLAPSDPASEQFAAGRQFLVEVQAAIAGNDSFIVESTLSGVTFSRSIESARQNSFRISIVYVFLESPESCIARVNARVLSGGHFVPEIDIRRRYYRSADNFWHRYRLLADDWILVYNSSSGVQDIASGDVVNVSISDVELFERFLAIAEGTND